MNYTCKLQILIIILTTNGTLQAQLPHTLNPITTNSENLGQGEGGNGIATEVTIRSDGTIFLANSYDGVRVYGFNGTEFIDLAHCGLEEGYANSVALNGTGDVFVSTGSGGLRAYEYYGADLINTAHVDDDSTGYYLSTTVGDDGTIFVANGTHGIRAYSYDGTSFYQIDHFDEGGNLDNIATDSDGTVFVATGQGLIAYNFDGSSFTHLGWQHLYQDEDVVISADGTLFTASNYNGLNAYLFDGSSFNWVTQIDSGGISKAIALGMDGTIFLASHNDGIRAFTFDGSIFTNTAHLNDGFMYPQDIAVGPDGTIYIASGSQGLAALSYSAFVGLEDEFDPFPDKVYLQQNYPNPFNPNTTISYDLPEQSIVNLTVYDIRGHEITNLQETEKSPGTYEVEWNGLDQSGNPVSTGVYFCRLQAGEFRQTIKMLYLQ